MQGYQELRFKITGVSALLMHNGRLADPRNEFSKAMKAISGKGKNKTDADLEQLAKLEFLGGLYLTKTDGPIIPGEMVSAMLINAARKSKLGKIAAAGLLVDGNFPLIYEGPRDPDELWENGDFYLTAGVKVGMSRVMRTRPIFRDWACEFNVHYLDDQLNTQQVKDFVSVAGRLVGLGDWRPKHGRFTSEVVVRSRTR